jgi:Uncharacterized alpha/beta hydrolase domain (DUF2235)
MFERYIVLDEIIRLRRHCMGFRMPKDHDEYEGDGGSGTATIRKGKHIILGIDGTWQAAFRDPFQSNIHRLNISLNFEDKTSDRNPQIFIYSAGVGTANRSSQTIAGATGEGMGAIILEAYINLASNYVPGDKIYIFGFSRGAFAARALTGLISYSGLLKANSLSLIEHAWRHFTEEGPPKIDYTQVKADATHQNVKVEFLGVWDTVSGPYKRERLLRKYRFTNLSLDRIVKCGVHIISIDESRGDYVPIPWEGCHNAEQIMEQIWMPGVHADIGGGYSAAFLSTASLLLMIDKLAQYCPDLWFDECYIEDTLLDIINTQDAIVNDERTGFWKYFGRSIARRIESSVLHHHRQHPIVDLLREKEIRFKSGSLAYFPSFFVSSDTGRLPLAEFHPTSWYLKKLKSILERKFPRTPQV